jgi:hypothetical protein
LYTWWEKFGYAKHVVVPHKLHLGEVLSKMQSSSTFDEA